MSVLSNTIPQAVAPSDPTLKDLLDLLKKDIFLTLSCHHIATIQSFDPEDQTATATINYKKTYFQQNALTGLYDPVLVDYPLLVDCPVMFLGGGAFAMTFPVSEGDECLVLFNDRDLDNWFQGNSSGALATPRTHSFSDGIILVGLRSLANVLTNFDSNRALLGLDDASAGVGVSEAGLIKVYNTVTTLNSELQNLITEIKSLVTAVNALVTATGAITVVCNTVGNPSSIPINSAAILTVATSLSTVSSQLTATATKIGELLE